MFFQTYISFDEQMDILNHYSASTHLEFPCKNDPEFHGALPSKSITIYWANYMHQSEYSTRSSDLSSTNGSKATLLTERVPII